MMSHLRSLLFLCVLAIPAFGSIQVGTKIKLDTSLPGGAGGQFGVTDPGNPAGFGFASFITFCVQIDEFIAHNGMYTVTGIDTKNTNGRVLGQQAAFLYTQFRSGLLSNFSMTSNDDANGVQYGIWESMGYTHTEIRNALGTSTADNYKSKWNGKNTVWLLGYDAWSGIGNVRVMQLGNKQDQLMIVPEPASMILWSLVGASVFGLKKFLPLAI